MWIFPVRQAQEFFCCLNHIQGVHTSYATLLSGIPWNPWNISHVIFVFLVYKQALSHVCLPRKYKSQMGYHWIMQFESFHWLSHHGLWAIIPCSTSDFGGCFYFYFSLVFYILGVFYIKQ